MKYDLNKIEKKWQRVWEKLGLHRADDFSSKRKEYILVEFPYPSGDGLHVGHVRSYTALDVVSRKLRMQGVNVLYPMGWDAFGLPTENYAIKMGIHPAKITARNIEIFKKQLKSLGLSFDWSREINTTDPNYYKWTQWIFLKLFEKGLAYQAEIPINWCPRCKIGLANEEVVQDKCERCGAPVEKKKLKQWMLKITQYADRLIEDLKKVDYLEKIKIQQINWIGRSEGTNLEFRMKNLESKITVFTTRVDTIFGVTALIIAPEHELLSKHKNQIENWPEVEKYIQHAKEKSDLERTDLIKEKTGVELKGIKAVNPINRVEISVWVGDYVIGTYGGGAVMFVPAHDKRDFDFAQKHKIPVIEVIKPKENQRGAEKDVNGELLEAFESDGVLINSGEFSDLTSSDARRKITDWLAEKKLGGAAVNYKLRDWVFSRQHYWGEPTPLIHCSKCGVVPVPEKDLPVELPFIKKYEPTGTGESPLAQCEKWVKTKCPKCGGPAKRETDTMPNWAGSSWYFIRYVDSKNKKVFADFDKMKYWLPVDLYNGGMEHTTLHLLYSRFWYKFLYDIGLVPTDEPYFRRRSQGMVLAEDGQKMSKSFGNVINPDEIVKKYGADVLRVYEMFMGPFDQAIAWNTETIEGVNRFLNKVKNLIAEWFLTHKKNPNSDCLNLKLERVRHKTIKKVTEDIENFKFNTAVAFLMEYINEMLDAKPEISKEQAESLLLLLAPFAPHLAEELWHQIHPECSVRYSIFQVAWPKYNPELIKETEIELVVQINGKVRDKIQVKADIGKEEAEKIVLASEKIKNYVQGQEIKKIIYVPGRLINIVV